MKNPKYAGSVIVIMLSSVNFATAQVGTGFFNDVVFNTYTSMNAGSLSGNNFTVSYSGAFSVQQVDSYIPQNLPSNTGYPLADNPPSLEIIADVSNNYFQYTFTSDLPQFTTLFIQDIDFIDSTNQGVKAEFFDASNTLINTSNIIVKTISTADLPVITTAATSITVTDNGADADEPLVALTIISTAVRRIKITQLSGAGADSYSVFVGIVRTDHGDAPAGYGDAMHFPSTTLRLGALGPDAEATAQNSVQADGDNNPLSANVINDEDGIASFPVLANSSTSYSITATVSNTTGSNATLRGWIDFNRNGIFDAGEASPAVTVTNGATSATVNWTGLSGLVVGQTYARFRIAANSTEVSSATGVAFTGEAEDYMFNITAVTPLSFISLSASRNGKNIMTTWKTETESNVSHFVVEYSTDARSFINAGSVDALNGPENSYHFVLNNFIQPLYYIRVKSVDLDGAVKYSSVALVKNTCSHARSMTISPNPVVGNTMNVHIVSDIASTCDIRVVNSAGTVVYQRKVSLIKGKNHVHINQLGAAAKGIYFVQATIGNKHLTKKIIIDR